MSNLGSTPPPCVYQLQDTSNEESYYVLGTFLSEEDALKALGEKPWELCENFYDDCAAITLRKYPVGLSREGTKVWERKWSVQTDEDGDNEQWVEHERKS